MQWKEPMHASYIWFTYQNLQSSKKLNQIYVSLDVCLSLDSFKLGWIGSILHSGVQSKSRQLDYTRLHPMHCISMYHIQSNTQSQSDPLVVIGHHYR